MDPFKKCFNGCGNDLRELDAKADAFQQCIEKNNCSDIYCGKKAFIQFQNACKMGMPKPVSGMVNNSGTMKPTKIPKDTGDNKVPHLLAGLTIGFLIIAILFMFL